MAASLEEDMAAFFGRYVCARGPAPQWRGACALTVVYGHHPCFFCASAPAHSKDTKPCVAHSRTLPRWSRDAHRCCASVGYFSVIYPSTPADAVPVW